MHRCISSLNWSVRAFGTDTFIRFKISALTHWPLESEQWLPETVGSNRLRTSHNYVTNHVQNRIKVLVRHMWWSSYILEIQVLPTPTTYTKFTSKKCMKWLETHAWCGFTSKRASTRYTHNHQPLKACSSLCFIPESADHRSWLVSTTTWIHRRGTSRIPPRVTS